MITRRTLVLGGLRGALAATSAGHTHAAQSIKSSQAWSLREILKESLKAIT